MIKWPWKVQESAHQTALPWQEALSIPLLTCLTEQEQSKLVTLAERFLQQKRLVPLQGFELDSLRSCRIALLFCLPVLELGLEWLDGFHEVLIYPAPFVGSMMNGKTISVWCITNVLFSQVRAGSKGLSF
ncbi:DgsA anti-repressor MtfA [Escherichia coli]|uniref:DgsA anti-repressor MtfA n=1 Tax=Escherichia coli TaxID=562 RepID=A0A2X3K9F5_ECOLX|nr:DgsA anti-repressor MtfA [Escherichia coli]